MTTSKHAASPTPSTGTQRRFALEQAEHSGEMEGLHIDPATRADAEEWVAGRIDVDELLAAHAHAAACGDLAAFAQRSPLRHLDAASLGAPLVDVGLQLAK